MFVINYLTYFIDLTMFQYLLGAFGFYGLFMCIRKVVFK